jgi:hypothetical protein
MVFEYYHTSLVLQNPDTPKWASRNLTFLVLGYVDTVRQHGHFETSGINTAKHFLYSLRPKNNVILGILGQIIKEVK